MSVLTIFNRYAQAHPCFIALLKTSLLSIQKDKHETPTKRLSLESLQRESFKLFQKYVQILLLHSYFMYTDSIRFLKISFCIP